MAEETGNSEGTIGTYRSDNTNVRSTIRIAERKDILGSGLEGTVHLVDVLSDKASTKLVHLASKEFHHGEARIAPYRRILENYELVKRAGLPVPHTFRARDDEKGFLMTDLTESGTNIVLSAKDIELAKIRDLYAQKPEQMLRYAHGQNMQSESVAARTNMLIAKASAANLYLRADTWFVKILPDGTYDFMIGDFSNVKKREELEKARHKPMSTEELLEINKNAVEYVKKTLALVQKYATDPGAVIDELYN